MYFTLSKILLFILIPINWVFVLFVMAVVKRKKPGGRIYFISGLVLLYLFSIPLLFKVFTRVWDVDPASISNTQKYSCVIVLGGFSGTDGQDGGRFNWAVDRFITGMQLVKSGKADHILVTGGNSSLEPGGFKEATWAKQQLIELGVADSAILTESNARNTLENAAFSKAVLDSNHLEPPYLLVTSAFHMRRAKMIFNKNGIDIVSYTSSIFINNNDFLLSDLLPQADILSRWELYTKEVVGYVVNYYSVN